VGGGPRKLAMEKFSAMVNSGQISEDDYGQSSLSHRPSLLIGVDTRPPVLASRAS